LKFFGSLSNLNDSSTQATFFCGDENLKSSSVVLYEDASERLLQQFTAVPWGARLPADVPCMFFY